MSKIEFQYEPDPYVYVRTVNALRATRFFEEYIGIVAPKVERDIEGDRNGLKGYKCKIRD